MSGDVKARIFFAKEMPMCRIYKTVANLVRFRRELHVEIHFSTLVDSGFGTLHEIPFNEVTKTDQEYQNCCRIHLASLLLRPLLAGSFPLDSSENHHKQRCDGKRIRDLWRY